MALRFTAGAGPAETAGNSSGNQALGVYGSAAGIRNNAYTPITSNATRMRTLDGTKSFNGQIQCPSTGVFLTVLLTPTGGGDANVTVGEDLDFDGIVEYTYSAPVILSGVCANGVISCGGGTWNNCRGFKWTADAAARVSLTGVSIADLGGCYCINNSCGNNLLFTATGQILGTVGGGVVGAIEGVSPKYTVTATSISGTSISYNGQDTKGCSAQAPAQNLPTSYYSGSGGMQGLKLAGDGTTEAQTESADPKSYYSLLQSAYSQSANPSQNVSCAIDRAGGVTTDIRKFSQAPTASQLCDDYLLFMRIHQADATDFTLEYLDTSPFVNPHWNCGVAFPWEAPIGADLWHEVAKVSFAPQNGSNYKLTTALFKMQNIRGPGCNSGSTTVNGLVNGFDTSIDTGIACTASGAQYPFFDYSYDFEWTEDSYAENVSDGCAAQEADPNCTLRDETVDGVTTWSNFMPTGITPLPSCSTFSGAISTFLECRNWWSKKRVYKCDTGKIWDFSDAKKRADNVVNTTADNQAVMNYQDLRKDKGGNWVADNETVRLGSRVDYSSPILACKTKKPSRKTDAVLSGNATQYLSNPDTWEFFYKQCDASGVCPVDAAAGEQIVTNCQVINEFAEAATVMNVLEGANDDMICSSGVKQ